VAHPTGTPIIRRTYSLVGQAIATRVSGDPVSTNNSLFFFYSDHLGSTSMLHKPGQSVPFTGSTTRYLPFGGYRGTAPSQAITDRDFTGQRENMELGLLYYNARYYLPGVGRFVSADTIVPDSTNPQSWNKYSYVYNNPLRYTDPTGHYIFEDDPSEPYIPPTLPSYVPDEKFSTWPIDPQSPGYSTNLQGFGIRKQHGIIEINIMDNLVGCIVHLTFLWIRVQQ
jgi:RHS repeat-associated protein